MTEKARSLAIEVLARGKRDQEIAVGKEKWQRLT